MSDTPIYDAVQRDLAGREARNIVREGLRLVTSKSPSAHYGVPCPTCKVGADQPCRTRTTKRVTDTHVARIEASA